MSESKSNVSSKPTIILTGFLGSGKTTYLNHILENAGETKYAIIENEFGKESIDSELILRAEDDVIELNNGCLCCTLNDNLYDILNTLYTRSDEYDKLVIEATGMADPRGIAAPFLTNPAVKKQFPLTAIVCLVDAELIEDQLEETIEAIHQITFSDILLINKTDLVSEEYLLSLSKKLKNLNPLCEIFHGKQGEYPIVKYDRNIFDNIEEQEVSNQKISDIVDSQFPVSTPLAHHHHSHSDVVSHTFKFDKPFDMRKLHIRMLGYLMFQSKGLYRMKGLIWVNQSEDQHLIQSVGSRLDIDKVRKWKEPEKKDSKIIMIGKNLERASLEKLFTQCI
jgi:G3E family GTPase